VDVDKGVQIWGRCMRISRGGKEQQDGEGLQTMGQKDNQETGLKKQL